MVRFGYEPVSLVAVLVVQAGFPSVDSGDFSSIDTEIAYCLSVVAFATALIASRIAHSPDAMKFRASGRAVKT